MTISEMLEETDSSFDISSMEYAAISISEKKSCEERILRLKSCQSELENVQRLLNYVTQPFLTEFVHSILKSAEKESNDAHLFQCIPLIFHRLCKNQKILTKTTASCPISFIKQEMERFLQRSWKSSKLKHIYSFLSTVDMLGLPILPKIESTLSSVSSEDISSVTKSILAFNCNDATAILLQHLCLHFENEDFIEGVLAEIKNACTSNMALLKSVFKFIKAKCNWETDLFLCSVVISLSNLFGTQKDVQLLLRQASSSSTFMKNLCKIQDANLFSCVEYILDYSQLKEMRMVLVATANSEFEQILNLILLNLFTNNRKAKVCAESIQEISLRFPNELKPYLEDLLKLSLNLEQETAEPIVQAIIRLKDPIAVEFARRLLSGK